MVATTGDFVLADRLRVQALPKDGQYWTLERMKRAYTGYLSDKSLEIDEQKDSRRYYHGTQWTTAQLSELRKRRQPPMTFNEVARKVNSIVGVVERLRQDPKAYPRTPQHEKGAELATAVLRYVLDQQDWRAKSPIAAMDGAIDGLAGVEIVLEKGDQGDPEIALETLDPDSFFYDPRSFKSDFSDARYMGYGKWMLEEDVVGLLPPGTELLGTGGEELSSDSDRDNKWYSGTEDGAKRIRVVDIWYKHRDAWCWALFTGSQVIMEGESYLKDEKGKSTCKFIVYSASIDQDGDRYGFVRNLKSAQDSENAKQSKLHHILASQRIIMREGAVSDIEKTREEWKRPDGVVVLPPSGNPIGQDIYTDNQAADFAGWANLLQLTMDWIRGYGPNPALMGEGGENQSGRAIQLLQQAGISELGPYMLAYRGWKVRVYRAIWNAVQHHWTAERYIRVTDDEGLAQFIKLNGLGIDPATGQPTIINAVGSLDVDIILDEGPDTITQTQSNYDTLMALGPEAPMDLKIELSPLDASVKKKYLDKLQAAQQAQAQQPNPEMVKLQAEMQVKERSAEIDAQAKAADLEIKRQSAAADIQIKRETAQADMEIEAMRAEQEMALERQKAGTQMILAREKSAAQNALAAERSYRASEAQGS